jgi:hypothetical protein
VHRCVARHVSWVVVQLVARPVVRLVVRPMYHRSSVGPMHPDRPVVRPDSSSIDSILLLSYAAKHACLLRDPSPSSHLQTACGYAPRALCPAAANSKRGVCGTALARAPSTAAAEAMPPWLLLLPFFLLQVMVMVCWWRRCCGADAFAVAPHAKLVHMRAAETHYGPTRMHTSGLLPAVCATRSLGCNVADSSLHRLSLIEPS